MQTEKEKTGNDIPKSSLTSAITSDLPNDKEAEEASARSMEEHEEKDPLVACGLGLIRVDGIDKRYVGKPPALEVPPAELPSGLKITPDNSTFIPLWQVPFHPSIEIKDPTTGTFYYPDDTMTSWQTCSLNGVPLVPPIVEAPPVRSKAAGAAKGDTADAESQEGRDAKAKDDKDKTKR
jgi:hypothetical protein